MLPKDSELPASTYEAKKVIFPLGLDVHKIHACPNDCILSAVRMRVLTHAWYAVHYGIRSDEMTLVMLTASPLIRLQRIYNL